jgi:hypothetical protein
MFEALEGVGAITLIAGGLFIYFLLKILWNEDD